MAGFAATDVRLERVLVLLAVTNRTVVSWWPFSPSLGRNKLYCLVLVARSGLLLAVKCGPFWPTVGRNISYCRVLVALSGPLLAVTNRTAGSWWSFWPTLGRNKIVLPGLGGSFWPSLGRNKLYCWVLVALSGPLLAVANRTAGSWRCFLPSLCRNKLYCWVLVVLPGPLLAVTP